VAPANPEVAALLTQRSAIEEDLNRVKGQKTALPENQYYDALEQVLVRLALLQREIDSKQANGGATP
jgi:hypothetical protein